MKNNKNISKLTILYITLMMFFPIIGITFVYFFSNNALIMILVLGAIMFLLGIFLIINALIDINKMFKDIS